MKFAANHDGKLVHANDATNSATVTCISCKGSLYARGSIWIHCDEKLKEKCPLAQVDNQQMVIKRSPYFDESQTLRGKVYKYCTGFFGSVATMYFTPMSKTPCGFSEAAWCRHTIHVCVGTSDATPVQVSIIKKEDDAAESIDVVRLFPAKGPLGETARKALQYFHRTAVLHVSPLHSAMPLWRSIKAPPGGGKTTLLLDIVRAWPACNFMLVTFARDIAEELRHRAQFHPNGAIGNLSVKTLDALCYAAEFESAGCSGDSAPTIVPRLDSRDIVQSSYPKCKPWNKKKGANGIGPIMEHILRNIPLTHSMHDTKACLCEKHAEFDWILKALMSPVPPRQGTWAGAQFARLRTSFASMRARAGRDDAAIARLRRSVSNIDILLVDEAQDLTPQALQILKRLAIPTIAVGDPRQCVYGYVDSRTCSDCVQLMESIGQEPDIRDGFAGASPECTLDLYETHRLDPFTCRLVDEWTNGKLGMVSTRPLTASRPIRIAHSIPKSDEPVLLLVRSNRELIDMAKHDASLGVVGGKSLAADLVHYKPKKQGKLKRGGRDRMSAIESMAIELCESDTFDTVCSMLEERDASLSMATEGRVVSSIHRCKGAEAPHVAVFSNVITSPNTSDYNEFCIMVVALTRHTDTLSIICADPPSSTNRGSGKRKR